MIHGHQVKDSCGEIIRPRIQRNSDQRSPHKKETLQMKSQDLLSNGPEFSFLCLPLAGFGALGTLLSYPELQCHRPQSGADGSHLQGLF